MNELYQNLFNNEADIQAKSNSKNNQTFELEKKANDLLDMLKILRFNNQDKCAKCGLMKNKEVVFRGVRGDYEKTLMCQQCDTNISACSRVSDENLF